MMRLQLKQINLFLNKLIKKLKLDYKKLILIKISNNVCEKIKISFIEFLLEAKKTNKRVIGYGAAAKGSTLLNYSGVKNDLMEICL